MNIIVKCGGGLCNRINNLINGIYLSHFLNRKLYVWWELDNACQCPVEKLFSNYFDQNYTPILNEEFVYYSPFNTDTTKHEIKNNYGESKFRITFNYDDYRKMYNRTNNEVHIISPQIISELKSIQSPTIIFSSSVIFTEIIPEIDVINILKDLRPILELQQQIDDQVRSHNINSSVIGVHLRKTDYNLLSDDYVMDTMNTFLKKDAKKMFLICSDSHSTEQKFKNLYPENVIIIQGKSYIEKVKKSKSYSEFSNLRRTEKSVQDALVDMYLLAHTSFYIYSPISTFAQTIFRLNKTLN